MICRARKREKKRKRETYIERERGREREREIYREKKRGKSGEMVKERNRKENMKLIIFPKITYITLLTQVL